jgi:hypothetical protein
MKVNSFSLDLLPGAYFIQLISTDSVSTQKFIVE